MNCSEMHKSKTMSLVELEGYLLMLSGYVCHFTLDIQ